MRHVLAAVLVIAMALTARAADEPFDGEPGHAQEFFAALEKPLPANDADRAKLAKELTRTARRFTQAHSSFFGEQEARVAAFAEKLAPTEARELVTALAPVLLRAKPDVVARVVKLVGEDRDARLAFLGRSPPGSFTLEVFGLKISDELAALGERLDAGTATEEDLLGLRSSHDILRAPGVVPLLRKAARRFPASTDVHETLGDACRAIGDHAEASQCYRKALELRPGPGDEPEFRLLGRDVDERDGEFPMPLIEKLGRAELRVSGAAAARAEIVKLEAKAHAVDVAEALRVTGNPLLAALHYKKALLATDKAFLDRAAAITVELIRAALDAKAPRDALLGARVFEKDFPAKSERPTVWLTTPVAEVARAVATVPAAASQELVDALVARTAAPPPEVAREAEKLAAELTSAPRPTEPQDGDPEKLGAYATAALARRDVVVKLSKLGPAASPAVAGARKTASPDSRADLDRVLLGWALEPLEDDFRKR